MANKGNVNSVKDGDLSNIIVLRSVWGKANQNYVLQPQRDKYGQLPKCVRRVNAQGDMILSEKDKEGSLEGLIPEDEQIVVHDGTVFDLNNERQAAEWEAIKNCFLIAPDRYAKDDKGNYKIDINNPDEVAKLIAKESADMILLDDNFNTIIKTIGNGRNIYINIRKCLFS